MKPYTKQRKQTNDKRNRKEKKSVFLSPVHETLQFPPFLPFIM